MADPFGLVGEIIDARYRIDGVAGEGGFGVVYRAFHLGFKRPIAIKVLRVPSHFTTDARERFLEKFREEGQHLARLSLECLSIVRVFDFGVTKVLELELPYLALEWLEGVDLRGYLDARVQNGLPALDERQALTFLLPAVEALAVAHRLGIAHRDVKPHNLFYLGEVDGAHRIKVLDFGIAKAMQEGESATHYATRTASGFSAFSPQNAAPEQFRSKKFGPTGPWTDVHALGLLLVELVTGRAPYDGDEHADFLDAATGPERPTPRSRGAKVSDSFEALCARALALQPKERYPSASESLSAMRSLLDAPVARVEATVPMSPQQHTEVRRSSIEPKQSKGAHSASKMLSKAAEVVKVAPPSQLPSATTLRRGFAALWDAVLSFAIAGFVMLGAWQLLEESLPPYPEDPSPYGSESKHFDTSPDVGFVPPPDAPFREAKCPVPNLSREEVIVRDYLGALRVVTRAEVNSINRPLTTGELVRLQGYCRQAAAIDGENARNNEERARNKRAAEKRLAADDADYELARNSWRKLAERLYLINGVLDVLGCALAWAFRDAFGGGTSWGKRLLGLRLVEFSSSLIATGSVARRRGVLQLSLLGLLPPLGWLLRFRALSDSDDGRLDDDIKAGTQVVVNRLGLERLRESQ